ncbi:MAG: peptide-methionine (S)-S-oxide reductase [Verrucomicrobia bacterium]|jgi:peptide-methionine (S)-S-oxide reductase|nr:MAG: peptide-methionine (S)-S-oxide reductase [Verrucomicrobiota bacterium]
MKRLALLLSLFGLSFSAMTAAKTPPVKTESIVLGGGCFWCTDAAYKLLPGVTHVTCGYAGGAERNPTYEDICAHTTGHAEVVKVEFDPKVVTLDAVIDYFWSIHNPTQVGGQGHDMGPQYRSIILYADAAQKAAAEKSRAEAAKVFRDPITTEIVPLAVFWSAEEYHQDYFAKNPDAGYCQFVIAPKVKKLKDHLSAGK